MDFALLSCAVHRSLKPLCNSVHIVTRRVCVRACVRVDLFIVVTTEHMSGQNVLGTVEYLMYSCAEGALLCVNDVDLKYVAPHRYMFESLSGVAICHVRKLSNWRPEGWWFFPSVLAGNTPRSGTGGLSLEIQTGESSYDLSCWI